MTPRKPRAEYVSATGQPCIECGQTCPPSLGIKPRVYCSKECQRIRDNRSRRAEGSAPRPRRGPPEPRCCKGCLAVFTSENPRVKVCSEKCRNALRALALVRHREKNGPSKPTPEAMHRYHLKSKYGLTPTDFQLMLARQGGTCAICKHPSGLASRRTTRLAVDHCHQTGRVRGLLCITCNLMIGYANDSIDIILAAGEYLEQSQVPG